MSSANKPSKMKFCRWRFFYLCVLIFFGVSIMTLLQELQISVGQRVNRNEVKLYSRNTFYEEKNEVEANSNSKKTNEMTKHGKDNTNTEVKMSYSVRERQRLSQSIEASFDKTLSVALDREVLKNLFPNAQIFHQDNITSVWSGTDFNGNIDRISLQLQFKLKTNTKPKLILLHNRDRNLKNEVFRKKQCNVNNCIISRNPADYDRADAVIFQQVPTWVKRPVSNPNQLWIYHQLESPLSVKSIPNGAYINWTATYRLDSVLPTPYEKFTLFDQKEIELSTFNFAKDKTKLVAWFVSNCNDKNGRMAYVKELQKYISVDVYGVCGELRCPTQNSKKCFNMLKNEYKFYLAFENSNCVEYVTEKLFNALKYDVIPVVMGAPIEDYKRIAPPESFIHVDQFENPQKLAEYLKYLDSNDNAYNAYFQWKGTGDFTDTKFQCRLCAMVNIAWDFPMWYKDINDWWRGDKCLPPTKVWNKWKKKD